jgi:hypothetical protein
VKNRTKESKTEMNGKAKPGAKAPAKKAGVMEFTVTIRIKPERQEWFSRMSDQLGLTRDQAISGMLERNMEADSNRRAGKAH